MAKKNQKIVRIVFMTQASFTLLSNYFKFIPVEYGKDNKVDMAFIKYYPEIIEHEDWKHGTALVEIETDNILAIGIDAENHREKAEYENELFRHYLQRLPDLGLKNVDFLLLLTRSKTKLDNAFKIPENYPSQFALSVLSDTYGQVVYSYQFMEFLRSSNLPLEERTSNTLNDYRRWFGLRKAILFEKLQILHLPDGINLYHFLQQYTPFRKEEEGFGFITTPDYRLAYEFINLAEKYM